MSNHVLVSPAALAAAAKLASSEASRPQLQSVLVSPDGTVTATDGWRLIQVAPSEHATSEEHPSLAPDGMHAPVGAGVIVPSKAAIEAYTEQFVLDPSNLGSVEEALAATIGQGCTPDSFLPESQATSRSSTWKTPRRRFGGKAASMALSFSVGSARR